MLEIHKIETLGALDGPGLRTVIFLQGCPMRCSYCHNADTWFPGDGTRFEVDALVKTIMRYRSYTRKNGGVTFSGGEPLMQSKALLPLIRRLKEKGLHIALDTSGCLFDDDVKAVLKAVDLVILDVKANTEKAFTEITGHSMHLTIAVLEHLKETEKPYWIRQVALKENDPDKNERIKEALDHLTASPYRQKLEILKQHTMGDTKRVAP
ncbi:MAG TPA: pyruvate formate lyase 1-activating protein [Clostridiales bacterium UBA8960]|nr:pyruvate formate lyase 1-activating protein [Clostridiales bacterium UBA8960]